MPAMRRLGLGLRAHYMMAYGMFGCVMPYVSLFLRAERGLSDTQIGWIHAEMVFGLVLAPVVSTYLADRWISNRALIGMTYLLGAIGMSALALSTNFLQVAGAYLLFALTMASMIPLINGLTMAKLDETPGGATGSFHRTRIFGTLGFIIPSIGLFAVMQWTPVTTESAMWMGAAVALLGALTTAGLPAHGPRPREDAPQTNDNGDALYPGEVPVGRGRMPTVRALNLLLSRPVIGFTLGVFALSTAGTMFFAFYPLYLDDLGIGEQWVGLVFNVGVVAELVCMLYVGRVRQAIGLRGIMLLGTAAGMVRFGLLAVVPTVGVAVGTQLLHGPMILTVTYVPVVYLNSQASADFRNSVQGLYTMVCRGVPRMLGAPMGGYLSTLGAAAGLGLAMTFGAAAGLIALALLAMFTWRTDE